LYRWVINFLFFFIIILQVYAFLQVVKAIIQHIVNIVIIIIKE